MTLTEENKTEFVEALLDRITDVKEAIVFIDTKPEALQYVMGSLETLRSLAKKLLSPIEFKDINEHIDSEINIINVMLTKLEKIEGKF